MDIQKDIFKAYDIRGKVPNEISSEIAYIIGKSYGTYIKRYNVKSCVVGRDNRFSSDDLAIALINGILDTGIDVVSLGLVTTPMFYYACILKKQTCGIMVTASHNPKDDNGFKFSFNEYTNARGKMIEDFRDFTLAGKFDKGNGVLYSYDIRKEYIGLIKHSIDMGDGNIKVVVDPGNGTTSIIVKEIFSLFPNLDVHYICDESNPAFPNHHPDPSVEENLRMLKKKVLEVKADLGIAFDGDGDRIGAVDEKGNMITGDLYMIIIIRDIINKVSKKEFLYDVSCTKALDDEIRKLGGVPHCCRTGASYTKKETNDNDLPFGGELSGHVYFRDRFPGFDSGIYAGVRLLEILSHTHRPLSSLLDGINKYYSTEKIHIHSPNNIKNGVVDKLKKYCENKGYEMITIDGIRVIFEDGWAGIRVSNTGPNITARFEATTEKRLESIKMEFMNLINEYNIY